MRIAFVHSFYRSNSPSGENEIVRSQLEALEAAGHEVTVISSHSDHKEWTIVQSISAGIQVLRWKGKDPSEKLKEFRPDVVHVHNLFPNFDYRWLELWNGAIVSTIHNFRSICANGLLFRDGKPCFECPDGKPWSAFVHGCYHESRLATIPLALRNRNGVSGDPLLLRSDALVFLSAAGLSVMSNYGLDTSRCFLVPNGIHVSRPNIPFPDGYPFRSLFLGRLSNEKGILELLQAWPRTEYLDVIGSGPLDQIAREIAGPNVNFFGPMERSMVLEGLPKYGALVMPSRCLDMQPSTVVEALGSEVPVIAWKGNSAATIVSDTLCGAVYDDDASLFAAIGMVRQSGGTLRKRARQVYEESFTMESWTNAIESTYAFAISNRN